MSTQYNFLDDSTQDDSESQDAKPDVGHKRANDLDGATWTKYSVSLWSDIERQRKKWIWDIPPSFRVNWSVS